MQSTISYKELKRKIAKKMRVDPSAMKIGYKFSTDAWAKAANHLSSASHLRELLENALALLRSPRAKKGKSFKVEIISLMHEEKSGKNKRASGKASHTY